MGIFVVIQQPRHVLRGSTCFPSAPVPGAVPAILVGRPTSVKDESRWVTKDIAQGHESCADVVAPGFHVNSTVGTASYRTMGSDDVAASLVGAVAAAYLSVYPDATPAQVRAWIISNAVSIEGTSAPLVQLMCRAEGRNWPPTIAQRLAEDNCYGAPHMFSDEFMKLPYMGSQDCYEVDCPAGEAINVVFYQHDTVPTNVYVDRKPLAHVPGATVTLNQSYARFRMSRLAAEYGITQLEPQVYCGTLPSLDTYNETFNTAVVEGDTDIRIDDANSFLAWEVKCPDEKPFGILSVRSMDLMPRTSVLYVGGSPFTGHSAPDTHAFLKSTDMHLVARSNSSFVASVRCTEVVEDSEEGVFEGSVLVNYTGGYSAGESAVWKLSCPASQAAFLAFMSFDLESGFDSLTVSRKVWGTGVRTTEDFMFTGSALPPSIPSSPFTTPEFSMRLTTDASGQADGFSALFF